MKLQPCLAFSLIFSFLGFGATMAGPLDEILNRNLVSCDPGTSPSDTASPEKCSEKADRFCQMLYDPKNPLGPGNLDLDSGDRKLKIRLGTNEGGIHHRFLAFQEAKLNAISSQEFPRDFADHLEKHGYVKKFRRYLGKGRPESAGERLRDTRMGDELSTIYNGGFEYIVGTRMEKRHPGYSKKKHLPASWVLERQRLEEELQIQIFRATWGNHPKWKRIEQDFSLVQKTFIETIRGMKEISEETRKKWIQSIETVKLKAAGTEDYLLGSTCPSTDDNAFYLPGRHVFTICAGKMTSNSYLRTMAHELAHAIGEARNTQLVRQDSQLGRKYLTLVKKLCEKQPAGCVDEWKEIRDNVSGEKTFLKPFREYRVETGVLRGCLLNNGVSLDREKLLRTSEELAATRANTMIANLANQGRFLAAVKPTRLNRIDEEEPSATFLSPCEGYPFVAENNTLDSAAYSFFIAEYQCSSETDPSKKMRLAIDKSREIQQEILESTIPMQGIHSSDSGLVVRGLAEDTEERFADMISSKVMARILRAEPEESRTSLFHHNLSTFCDPPGNDERYPDEAMVQKMYDPEPHSLNPARRRELLTREICEILGCDPEPGTKECNL